MELLPGDYFLVFDISGFFGTLAENEVILEYSLSLQGNTGTWFEVTIPKRGYLEISIRVQTTNPISYTISVDAEEPISVFIVTQDQSNYREDVSQENSSNLILNTSYETIGLVVLIVGILGSIIIWIRRWVQQGESNDSNPLEQYPPKK